MPSLWGAQKYVRERELREKKEENKKDETR